MADGEKRIVELTETQTFGNGDYLPLDNISNSETKKIEAKKLGITYTMTDTEDGFTFDGSNGYSHNVYIPNDEVKKYGDFVSTTDVTIDEVTYKTFWVIAPTSSNQVYGIANHPTNGKLYKIYNNSGTYTAEPYDLNATKGNEISTNDGQIGTVQTGVVSTIAANTSLDNAIGTLLNNDVTQDKQISDIESDLTDLESNLTDLKTLESRSYLIGGNYQEDEYTILCVYNEHLKHVQIDAHPRTAPGSGTVTRGNYVLTRIPFIPRYTTYVPINRTDAGNVCAVLKIRKTEYNGQDIGEISVELLDGNTPKGVQLCTHLEFYYDDDSIIPSQS